MSSYLEILERLELEHSELEEKINKLDDFIETNPVVREMQRILMDTQLNAMKLYLYTLNERIYDLSK